MAAHSSNSVQYQKVRCVPPPNRRLLTLAVACSVGRLFLCVLIAEEGGQLTTKLAKYPNAVVLIDEVEKVRILTNRNLHETAPTNLKLLRFSFAHCARAWRVHVNILCFF